jgi:lipopolysaccharide/colanic/teichoic acid biosynthesis glycosyltransferase
MLKRIFDIFFSLFGLLFFSPLFLIIAIFIKATSKGSIFYSQIRVGKDRNNFELLKFRTMIENADKQGLLTVGNRDFRVTNLGYYMRKFKLDELPQLINIFLGEMSFVGPRPEVEKYVNLYNVEQLKVLKVKPGLTDFASIEFIDENALLAKSENPELTYITEVMPAKLKLNAKYIQQKSLAIDLKIIFKTLIKIVNKA